MFLSFVFAGTATLLVFLLTVKFFLKREVKNLHTKYVLITGCDSGFGRETAIRLDKMGVNVLATCLTKQGEQDLKSMTSNRLKTFQMDVTDSEQIKDVFEQVKNMLPTGQGKDILLFSVFILLKNCFPKSECSKMPPCHTIKQVGHKIITLKWLSHSIVSQLIFLIKSITYQERVAALHEKSNLNGTCHGRTPFHSQNAFTITLRMKIILVCYRQFNLLAFHF